MANGYAGQDENHSRNLEALAGRILNGSATDDDWVEVLQQIEYSDY